MAWISIDQNIQGSALRSLHKRIGCSEHEALGILVDLWLWCVNNADRDGLLVDADKGDIAAAIRSGLAPGIDPAGAVDALIQTGWIAEGQEGLYVPDWPDHISYYDKIAHEKAARSERMKRYRERHAGDAEEPEPEDAAKIAAPRKETKYGPEFEEFWSAYPRKADKGQAYKKYLARRGDGFSAEELLKAAGNYRIQCENAGTESQYIKQAKTFLSESLPFREYIDMPAQPAAKKKNSFNNFQQRGDTDYDDIQSALIRKQFEERKVEA